MKKVMVFGAFDGLHPGHLDFFRQAKRHGDFLIVSVGTDANVAKIKGKRPLFGEDERLALVKSLRVVNRAVLGVQKDFYKEIKKYNPDVICLGYDQWARQQEVEEELSHVGLGATEVVRLAPYKAEKSKSTQLKRRSVDFLS